VSIYRDITPNILNNIWFSKLDLHRLHITQFNILRIGHSLLSSHSFKLGLNDSPFCTLHLDECTYDLSHILFDCPALITEHLDLIKSLRSFNCPFNLHSILNTNCIFTIKCIIKFILDVDFII
jgi:hypothetical protein